MTFQGGGLKIWDYQTNVLKLNLGPRGMAKLGNWGKGPRGDDAESWMNYLTYPTMAWQEAIPPGSTRLFQECGGAEAVLGARVQDGRFAVVLGFPKGFRLTQGSLTSSGGRVSKRLDLHRYNYLIGSTEQRAFPTTIAEYPPGEPSSRAQSQYLSRCSENEAYNQFKLMFAGDRVLAYCYPRDVLFIMSGGSLEARALEKDMRAWVGKPAADWIIWPVALASDDRYLYLGVSTNHRRGEESAPSHLLILRWDLWRNDPAWPVVPLGRIALNLKDPKWDRVRLEVFRGRLIMVDDRTTHAWVTKE